MPHKKDIPALLREKGNPATDEVATAVLRDHALLSALWTAADSAIKKEKNAAAKTLQLVSAQAPELLYADFARVLRLLESADTIMKWTAMDLLGNLAAVDREHRIDKSVLKKLKNFLADRSMVTAAHAIDNLGRIAAAKPALRAAIVAELLRSDEFPRETAQCREILAGKIIDALLICVEQADIRQQAVQFARKQQKSARPSTQKKAAQLLHKLVAR